MNWYQRKKIFWLATYAILSGAGLSAVAERLERQALKCGLINAAYEEVYSFETENYYINVCQQDSDFFYHRQSKLTGGTNILIPAAPVPRSNVYQAQVGKTIYFVGQDSNRYYSSVMLNDNEIVFEPELEPVTSVSQPRRREKPEDNEALPLGTSASWELDLAETESETELVCERDRAVFNPHLQGWQKLIGQSVVSANRYAVTNGYDFDYDLQSPHSASISTQNGTTVDLKIASSSATVEGVCIQSSNAAEPDI